MRQRLARPVRSRPLPPLDELLQGLAEEGVTDAPAEGEPEALRGLLLMALHVAEHRKQVRFPGFTWDAPSFTVQDAKTTLRVHYVRAPAAATLQDVDALLRASLPRVAQGHDLLGLDLHGTALREFEVTHHLYGSVTLFAWPHKPAESADHRIDAAREAGWVKTLKEHNLLPGRGIVVLDENQGILLRDPAFKDLLGLMTLLPTGQVHLLWNPFVDPARATSEIQYWLAWGPGTGSSSEWRELIHVHEGDG